jgi:hypothetical protein
MIGESLTGVARTLPPEIRGLSIVIPTGAQRSKRSGGTRRFNNLTLDSWVPHPCRVLCDSLEALSRTPYQNAVQLEARS